MATIQLDRIDQILKQINADARQTELVFRDIASIVERMQAAQLAGMRQELRASADAAMRLDRGLRGAAEARERLTRYTQPTALPTRDVTQITGALSRPTTPTLPTDPDVEKRMAEFTRMFQLQGRGAEEAAKFLRRYGFEAQNIKRVLIDPITQTRQFTAEMRQANGVISRATFAFDRFGNVVGDSGTRFKGFTDMISRNTVKVLEWAIAVGVVYGALAQLSNVVNTLIDLNEIMSDIAITTQESGAALNSYFESAVRVARATGISVREVLTVYDDALRATASIADEQERAAVSTQLLTDAMTLSRLTGMDVNASMDSLIGALKQFSAGQHEAGQATMTTAETFAQGEIVLGTWILAAREGKISLNDLAETFAITGAAASAAGLDIAELTALTTVLAENTVKSASEIGNSIRRMITTIQSESGIGALRRVGIAVEDLNGQMRDWDEIMRDIAERRRAGALTDAAFRQLTYSLGGGPRGAADVAAVIETWDQVIAKTELFSNRQAAMEARQAAVAAKSQTLKSALNDLNTAFVDLVNTLGAEGGLLNTMTTILEVFTGLVEGVQEFTDTIGPATTRILALGAAMAVLQRYGPTLATTLGGAQLVGGRQVGGIMRAIPGANPPMTQQQTGFRGFAQQATRTLATPQMAVAAGFALSQLGTEGTMQERGVRVGTTIAGAIIGSLTPAGPIIGAAIGDAAGNALLSFMQTHKLRTSEVIEFDSADLMQAWESTFRDLTQRLSPAGLLAGIFEPEKAAERAEEFMKAYREKGRAAAEEFAAAIPTLGPKAEQEYIDFLDEAAQRLLELEERQQALGMATQAQLDTVNLLKDARSEEIARINAQIESLGIAADIQDTIFEGIQKMASGEISKKEFKDLKAGGEEFLAIGGTVYEVFQDIMDIPIEDFADRFVKMTPEIREEFQGLATDAAQLEEAILVAPPERARTLRRELEIVQEQMRVLFNMATAFDASEAFKFKGFVDIDATEAEFEMLLQRAIELQEEYAAQLGFDPEDLVGSAEEWIAHFEEIFRGVEGVHQQFFKLAESEWKEMKKNIEDAFNLQRLRNISPGQIPELEQRVNFWRTYLSRVPGYEEQAEEQPFNLVLGEENVFHRLITTQEALRFAIQDLTEVEEKQLEGMWNIPAGATVMVPLQSLYYAPKGGGGAGVPNLPPFPGEEAPTGFGGAAEITGLDQPASKMDTAGDKMLSAAEMQMQQSLMWGKAVEAFPEGFGPEESMWNKAVRAWPEGGFGPEMSDQDKMLRMIEPMLVDSKATEVEVQSAVNQVPGAVKEGFQGVQIDIPPIDATITLNIPAITLNGKAVSEALSIQRTERLTEAARARGMLGGGVVQ